MKHLSFIVHTTYKSTEALEEKEMQITTGPNYRKHYSDYKKYDSLEDSVSINFFCVITILCVRNVFLQP